MTPHRGNTPRYRLGTDHVESWFLRFNHPTQARAVWLKATVLTRRDGSTLVQAWCSTFDDDVTRAFCAEVPHEEADVTTTELGTYIDLGGLWLDLGSATIRSGGDLTQDDHHVEWDLTFDRTPGPLGAPLSLLPSDRLLDGRLPRNKLLTPFPSGTCTGRLSLDGVSWDLDGWIGMQGHNWGVSHSPEYAWGQCLFLDEGTPAGMVEAASGRTEIGRHHSPLVSMLVVRRGDREYRFDRLVDLWRQRPEIRMPRWRLTMAGRPGRVSLRMEARRSRMVRLDYRNPARATSSCFNSKTADVLVRVEPTDEPAFTLHSPHGGALEFLCDQEPA